MHRRVLLFGALGWLGLTACAPTPANHTPDGAVRDFVERLNGFAGEETEARAIYELLSQRARDNLELRAERYSAASGKKIAPWAMLVPGRMMLHFVPRAYSSQIVGKYALVEVVGVSSNEHAEVPCVREDEAWRVDLVLPELPEMQQRPGVE